MTHLIQCDCGNEHVFHTVEFHHAADATAEKRKEDRRVMFGNGHKQKMRIHCDCGQRIELLFKHGDGRR